jgi:para-aminobenzoate synthetase component 1
VLKKIIHQLPSSGIDLNIDALNKHFNRLCILDSNSEANQNKYINTGKTIAVGVTHELVTSSPNALEELQHFCNEKKNSWLFGYLSYDLKNEIEQLHSGNTDNIAFPALHFFAPEVVFQIQQNTVTLFYDDNFVTLDRANCIYRMAFSLSDHANALDNVPPTHNSKPNHILSKVTRQEYLHAVNQLKQHIHKGDIYEINFCQEFYAENAIINTVDIYQKLNAISQASFSAYYKLDSHYLMCASPERFMRKQSGNLISQPIKGTAKRSADTILDGQLKNELLNSEKEKSENVMIVDLVRNDLSKVAKRGSVHVDELFGIYSFKQVHQMISTISCEVKDAVSFVDIIRSTFPMGSMTGAPKVSAMKLIEKYESTKRGLYSGAVGYIKPDGDFDFNVVIRSILYNEENKYLSFMVGSAITDKSSAESEYEECLLKAKAMFEVLM